MIVKGAFESVSMAIYGDVVNELPPPKTTYEPRPLPTLDPIPLSPALDPANARDPTTLSRQLLYLIPDAPPLPLIIRLMFCLKPSNEDWDLPDFPYLFADLSQLPDDPGIDEVYRTTMRPVSDETTADTFADLAEKVTRGLNAPASTLSVPVNIANLSPQNDSQSYYLAGILSHAACQHPGMATALTVSRKCRHIFSNSRTVATGKPGLPLHV